MSGKRKTALGLAVLGAFITDLLVKSPDKAAGPRPSGDAQKSRPGDQRRLSDQKIFEYAKELASTGETFGDMANATDVVIKDGNGRVQVIRMSRGSTQKLMQHAQTWGRTFRWIGGGMRMLELADWAAQEEVVNGVTTIYRLSTVPGSTGVKKRDDMLRAIDEQ
jgi:hypothetical protein